MKRIVTLGGSFNPIHNGHLRVVLEVGEALQADRLDFVPSFCPPHKQQSGMLPFKLRVEALRRALSGKKDVYINLFEAELEKSSYSIYTLQDYTAREPDTELFFILGIYDFAQLDKWYRWDELITYANLAVVARQGGDAGEFMNISRRLWPGCTFERPGNTEQMYCFIPRPATAGLGGRDTACICFLPVPRLDISSSLLRQKWLAGQSLDFLTPEAVINLLNEHREEVKNSWQSFKNNCQSMEI